MKIILVTLFLFTVSSSLLAQTVIPADDPNLQYIDRFSFADPKAPAFDWPGVQIAAVFEGTSLSVRLSSSQSSFSIFVDDKLIIVDPVGSKDYPVAQDLKNGPHNLLIVLRTGHASFLGLVLDPGKKLRKPPVRPSRKIEFIGDSFSAGTANEAISLTNPANMMERSNAYTAFGPLTARHFNADYSLIAMPGIGLIGGSFKFHMSDIYQRTLSDVDKNDWDFSKWQPDLVVIYLGLNDGVGGERVKLFSDAYVAFLKTVRTKYPKATIIGIWNGNGGAGGAMRDAVKRFNDPKVFAADFNTDLGNGGTGPMDGFHPNNVGHQRLSASLVKIINDIMHWDKPDKAK